jgi:hypothetical protein
MRIVAQPFNERPLEQEQKRWLDSDKKRGVLRPSDSAVYALPLKAMAGSIGQVWRLS